MKNKTYGLIAFIFCIVSCCSVGVSLIPLLWMIPLTIKVYKAWKYGESISTGCKICVLIFVSIVSGIFLLIDD